MRNAIFYPVLTVGAIGFFVFLVSLFGSLRRMRNWDKSLERIEKEYRIEWGQDRDVPHP